MGKLFGESLDELANREIELKRKAVVSANTKKEEKRKLTLQEKTVIVSISIIAICIIIAVGSTVFSILTAPKADIDGFKKSLSEYLVINEDIVEIQIQDNDIFKVIVKDSWYNSSEVDKIRFCKDVHSALYTYAHQYKLIYKDNDNVYINFYDTTDIKLAEQHITDFEILH